MTEHDDKQVASIDAMANAEPSKGRRRFVKTATLAGPAVMTLCNGRLAVAASLCTENVGSTTTDTTGLPILPRDYPDNGFEYLFNVPVTVYKKKRSGTPGIFYHTDTNNPGIFYDYDGFVANNITLGDLKNPESKMAYKLVQWDLGGNQVALSESCWTSLHRP